MAVRHLPLLLGSRAPQRNLQRAESDMFCVCVGRGEGSHDAGCRRRKRRVTPRQYGRLFLCCYGALEVDELCGSHQLAEGAASSWTGNQTMKVLPLSIPSLRTSKFPS